MTLITCGPFWCLNWIVWIRAKSQKLWLCLWVLFFSRTPPVAGGGGILHSLISWQNRLWCCSAVWFVTLWASVKLKCKTSRKWEPFAIKIKVVPFATCWSAFVQDVLWTALKWCATGCLIAALIDVGVSWVWAKRCVGCLALFVFCTPHKKLQ